MMSLALTKLSKVTDLPLENETSDIIHIKDDIQSIEFKMFLLVLEIRYSEKI